MQPEVIKKIHSKYYVLSESWKRGPKKAHKILGRYKTLTEAD